jgi:DNA-binding HxlR family transcriptional regulator
VNLEPQEVGDFLSREGAVGLIVKIDCDNGSLFGELEERVHVSQTTLSKRITEAQKLGIVDRTVHHEDHGNAKRYVLTDVGLDYRVACEIARLDKAYKQFFDGQQQIDQGTQIVQNLQQKFNESGTSLTFRAWLQKEYQSN